MASIGGYVDITDTSMTEDVNGIAMVEEIRYGGSHGEGKNVSVLYRASSDRRTAGPD